jgi:glycosyltransferase involved in cell wall biosynthesis
MSDKVSVICTLLNEGSSVQKLLDSLTRQTRQPDQIIFVDGGSSDDTVARLEQFAHKQKVPVEVLVAAGANISRGRNIAIEAAAGPIIASTDAGVRLDQNWLHELLKPFQMEPQPAVVAGFFVPDPQSAFEVAMGATVLPHISDIDPDTFLPSSRSVAFHKSSWEAAGRYPEWLDYCEDLIFDFRLLAETGPFAFAPAASVYFRPRGSLRSFVKQYYRYARGDGKADLWRKRHFIRYFTYLVALPLTLLLGAFASPWWWLLGAGLGFFGMLYRPYRRLFLAWPSVNQYERIQTLIWVPIIRIMGDLAKMIGYPVGWKWRFERLNSQPELRWQRYKGVSPMIDG